MRTANFERWIAELRTTDLPQADGALARSNDKDNEPVGYCCLGFGCVIAGVPFEVTEFPDEAEDGRIAVAVQYRFVGALDLAPIDFIAWLTETRVSDYYEEDRETSWDVWPEWGELGDLPQQNERGTTHPYRTIGISGAGMNDSGFTFAQIADVFDYFGYDETKLPMTQVAA